ncbi:hAT family dimerization protein [Ceratobasidium sp. AG-Ba]|nr:hAT family dimerization protein [Ceratobasidium sp. AG-Ba]
MSTATPPSPNTPVSSNPAPDEPVRRRLKRRKGLSAMSDAEVWDESDLNILDAERQGWRSNVYDHYNVALERHFDGLGEPNKLVLRFDCQFDSPHHVSQFRERLRTGDGTQNLLNTARACNRQRGVLVASNASLYPQLSYSATRHRAILALRCARDRRPFESVVDELAQLEVEMLRPGTHLPTGATLSRDALHLYQSSSLQAANHLRSVAGALHLAVDGWTSPSSQSFLGVVVFWYEQARMYKAILEFVHLTAAHTGGYMAERIHDCLKRYGIAHKLMGICLDNASNNNTLVTKLEQLVGSFNGPQHRVRCFAHIINLMAKAFMALFMAPTRRSKPAASSNEAARPPSHNTTQPPNNKAAQRPCNGSDDPSLDPEEPTDDVDPDKLEHDIGVTQGVVAQAIAIMASSGMHLSPEEIARARQIIPKISGLARRVKDSAIFTTAFEELVDKDPDLQGDAKALPTRCATRWNTDGICIAGHLHFKTPVQWLTSNPRFKLKKYALTDQQWQLAAERNEVLEVFQEPTNRFSQSEVPLVHETLPEILTLRSRLCDIRDDVLGRGLHRITRVAAEASLQVFEKYMGAMGESDIYTLSVVMCPDRKLKWFADRGFLTEPIRDRLVERFDSRNPQAHQSTRPRELLRASGSIWTQRHTSTSSPPVHLECDSIQEYLETPVVSPYVISQYGGVLAYWDSELERRPRVARLALDLLTVPASSVDAERAFSGGRLMMNRLQHRMSTRTFQAQMAIGSWYGTPLLPELDKVAEIIEYHM